MSTYTRRTLFTLLGGASVSFVACQKDHPSQNSQNKSSSKKIVTLNGSGATFPGLLYQRWFKDYNQLYPQVQINYQPIGSAAGIQQFLDKTIDFAGSDIALSDEEIGRVDPKPLMLPMTAGSIVITYNLPGLAEPLKLSRQVYVDIFLGKITRWQDPSIQALNPNVTLPDLPIYVLYRADGSGTTATFTRHLSQISSAWQSQVGSGLSVNWPVGSGVKGNEGVSAQVQLIEGVIAYLEYAYAKELNLAVAALENQAGRYVLPTPETATLTLAEIQLPENLRGFIADPAGADAYPVVTYTWILAYQSYPDPSQAQTLKQVLKWCLTEGQKISLDLGFLPLPEAVGSRVIQVLERLNP
jgi:phosphate transport system substrate-binding protein